MNLPNYSIGRHRQLGSPANLMGILSLNIVQDERKTMRTLSYRMDFKHWLPMLYPRARIDLTNWLLTSFGGKDLQETASSPVARPFHQCMAVSTIESVTEHWVISAGRHNPAFPPYEVFAGC
jgi:hypothetical protein